MAVEVGQFLRSRCLSLLQEEREDPSGLPLISRFQSIEEIIKSKNESTMISKSSTHDLLYNLIDALSECRVFANQRKGTIKKGLSRSNLLAEPWFIRQMKKRLRHIEQELQRIDGQRYASPPRPRGFPLDRQTYHLAVDASKIIGFDNDAKKMEDSLIDPKNRDGFTAIGIVGMAGTGKTALAQKVFDSRRVREAFSLRIWVCLSETLSGIPEDLRVKVVKYMLEELGYDVDELTSDLGIVELLENLNRRLAGKRYLIVLDDVWHIDEWYADLGYRLPKGDKIGDRLSHGFPKRSGTGGAIIVTSRRRHVAEKMVGVKNLVRLDPRCFSTEDCWKIFADSVDTDGVVDLDHSTLVEMEDEISYKCDGLPLAAMTLAKIIPSLIREREGF